jgi:acetyltransferase-like isoleucine patch superfamily enzyme
MKIPRGRHTYGPEPILIGRESIAEGSSIGSFCSIADNLQFLIRGAHMINWVSTFPFKVKFGSDVPLHDLPRTSPIIIGHDVWIASNVKIKQGVTIGNGAVLAQESFITRDVPPYSVVGGFPAEVIKFRFTKNQIEKLLKIAWWEWSDSRIKECVHLLTSSNIDEFIKYAEKG